MDMLQRGAIFVGGILVGAAVGGWLSQRDAQAERSASASAASASAAPAPQRTAATACPAQPLLQPRGNEDGRFQAPGDPGAHALRESGSFLVVGKEAAAGGRPRDAEVAFLAACRIADHHAGATSPPAADARYQLARHYLQGAQQAGTTGRPELLRRAELLYTDSLASYRSQFGAQHERTRFAQEGLASVRQAMLQPQEQRQAQQASAATTPAGQQAGARAGSVDQGGGAAPRAEQRMGAPAAAAAQPQPAPPRNERVATAKPPAKPPPPDRQTAVARSPATQPAHQAPATPTARPSFDCAKARSVPERLICADPELARLDRDLGRLHAQARREAADPAAFKRRSDSEWSRREATCRDRDCLRRWYAQRASELQAEIDQARPGPQSTALR